MEKMAKAAYDSGDWETGDKISTAAKAQAQAKAALQKTYLEANDLEQKQLRGMTQTAGAAAQAAMSIKDPMERWAAWQQTLPRIAQQVQPSPTDTPKMQQIKQSMIQQLQAEAQGLMAMKGPEDLDALLTKHINDSKTHEDWMKEAEAQRQANKVVGFHPALGPDGKPGIFQTTGGGDVKQVPGLKPIPPAPMVMTGPGTPSMDPSKRSSRAEQIANGEIPVPKPTRGDPTALRDVADARQIMIERGLDPQDLPGLYSSKKTGQESFAAGKPNARIITAINTASDHTEKILRPAAAALNNGDWQTANKIMNAVGVNLGNNEKTNFDAVATFLATEVAKVASGGGVPTLSEIAEARKMFPAEGSNKQIMGAIDIANRIMGGKLSALDIEHKNAFNGKSIRDMKRLSPEAIRNIASTGGEEQKKSAPKTYKVGDTETARDGTKMVFLGGDPMKPASWKKVR
jgi:hypothetical protein